MAAILKIGHLGNFVTTDHVLTGWFWPRKCPWTNDTTHGNTPCAHGLLVITAKSVFKPVKNKHDTLIPLRIGYNITVIWYSLFFFFFSCACWNISIPTYTLLIEFENNHTWYFSHTQHLFKGNIGCPVIGLIAAILKMSWFNLRNTKKLKHLNLRVLVL